MILAAYAYGVRALTPFAWRCLLGGLALAMLGSLGVAALARRPLPIGEAKYSTLATQAVVRGGAR